MQGYTYIFIFKWKHRVPWKILYSIFFAIPQALPHDYEFYNDSKFVLYCTKDEKLDVYRFIDLSIKKYIFGGLVQHFCLYYNIQAWYTAYIITLFYGFI